MLDLIDVGMGNIRSISNILCRLGVSSKIITEPKSLSSNTIILPGVGSALPFMKKICAQKFDSAIKNHVMNGKRIIGICLGFQVMTDFSEEDGGTECLGLINTNTVSIHDHHLSSNHNQWEKLSLKKEDLNLSHKITPIVPSRKLVVRGRVFYNHEFGVKIPCDDKFYHRINDKSLSSFASIYSNRNIIGLQFHPEKSQNTGLDLLSMIL
ncbi:imidazole glycerol phosphate synthase subunit HisH [Synechococcus sp. AH-707-M23]|nr:imidazole glycerol phosphate synthase subunit HisH [Synechococcus sp. AH-707-M23]